MPPTHNAESPGLAGRCGLIHHLVSSLVIGAPLLSRWCCRRVSRQHLGVATSSSGSRRACYTGAVGIAPARSLSALLAHGVAAGTVCGRTAGGRRGRLFGITILGSAHEVTAQCCADDTAPGAACRDIGSAHDSPMQRASAWHYHGPRFYYNRFVWVYLTGCH